MIGFAQAMVPGVCCARIAAALQAAASINGRSAQPLWS
jgi:hypothetical protein